jgi:hypothetical protein
LKASQHELVNFVSSHANKGYRLNLVLRQASTPESADLVRSKFLHLVRRLWLLHRLLRGSPLLRTSRFERAPVVTEATMLQLSTQLINDKTRLEDGGSMAPNRRQIAAKGVQRSLLGKTSSVPRGSSYYFGDLRERQAHGAQPVHR